MVHLRESPDQPVSARLLPVNAALQKDRSIRSVAIVCAKNEAPRIQNVLDVLVPKIPTLVIDDGSSDDTAAVAKRCGATVLSLPSNVGKGRAMLMGTRIASFADVVVFVDADLTGLRPEHIDRLIEPVEQGQYGMMVGMRDYGPKINELVRQWPLISGERAVRRDLLLSMPDHAWRGYAVETWMNHVVASARGRIGTTLLDGLSVVLKWEKEGLDQGFQKMAAMGAEVVQAHVDAATQAARVLEAPTPVSVAKKGASSDEVMRALSQTLVETGGPFVRDELWTREAQRQVGHAVGERLAAPMWTIACAACTVLFGPLAGISAAIGAMMVYGKTRRLL